MEGPHGSVAMQVMVSAVMLMLAVTANLAAGQSSSLYAGGNNNDDGGRGGGGRVSPPPPARRNPPPPPPTRRNPPPPPPTRRNPPPPPPTRRNPPPPPPTRRTPPPPPSSPGCKKIGGVCGDPRIVGGDGVVFYFHGRKNQDFCLVSDSDLHINAHFIGKRPEGRPRDFTWVQALGFVFGSHTLTVAAKPVAKWDNSVDHLEFSYDGVAMEIETTPMSSWTSADKQVTLERIGATNTVDVRIKEKMGVALSVVPIGKKESDVHGYGIGDDDCFAHLDMQFRFHNLSSSVNGVLGQTYQPGYVNPTKRGVVMPIMGGADRFQSSSLQATDCKVSQYTATAIAAGSAMPSFNTECGSSSGLGGSGGILTCRR